MAYTPTPPTITAWPTAAGAYPGDLRIINGVVISWNGVWWEPVGGDPAKWINARDDRGLAQAAVLNGHAIGTFNGAGTAQTPVNTVAGRFGLSQITTGTTLTGGALYISNTAALINGAVQHLVYEADLTIDTLSTTAETFMVEVGLFNSSTVEATISPGYFYYTAGASPTNWRCKTAASSGSRTDNDSTILPVAGTFYRLRVEVDELTGTTYFYIDGTLRSTITTTRPAAATTFGMGLGIVKSAGTTGRTLTVDRMAFDRVEAA